MAGAMAEAGKSLDEIALFLRETVKNMGKVLGMSCYIYISCNESLQVMMVPTTTPANGAVLTNLYSHK